MRAGFLVEKKHCIMTITKLCGWELVTLGRMSSSVTIIRLS